MAELEIITQESATALVLIPAEEPKRKELFEVENGLAPSLQRLTEFVNMTVLPDASTAKGRDEIRTFAFKLTKTRTGIEDVGKKLAEKAKAVGKIIDANRKEARETIEALEERVRKPLTDWETAEKERKDRHIVAIEEIRGLGAFVHGKSVAELKDQRDQIDRLAMVDMEEFADEYELALGAARGTLDKAIIAAEQAQAEQAELAQLRAEKEERDRVERERIEAEAAQRREEEAKRREAEAEERRQREIKDAEERGRQEAAKAAQAALDKAAAEQRAAEEILAYIRQVRDGFIGGQPQNPAILLRELEIKIDVRSFAERFQPEIERARAEAHQHITRLVDQARLEEQQKAAKEAEERRAANKAHQAKINREAAEAIARITLGTTAESGAKLVVAAIARGEIPHILIRY